MSIRVIVQSNYPPKQAVIVVPKDGTSEEAKAAAAKGLDLDLKAYTWSAASFLEDVTDWATKADSEKHGLSEFASLVASAPAAIIPRRKKEKPADKEEALADDDDKFKSFTVDNVWKKLESKGKEAKVALEFFDMNADVLLEDKNFLNVPKAVLMELLPRDNLGADSELQVFQALLRWGEAELKRNKEEKTTESFQKVLAPLIPFIRFPTMTTEQVASKVAPSGVLQPTQTLELFTFLASRGLAKLGASIAAFKTTAREGSGTNFWNTEDMPDKRLELTGDNLIVASPSSGFSANIGVRAKHGWTSGKHYWELKVVLFDGGGNGYNSTGVATKDAPLTASHGYPLEAASGQAWVVGMYRLEISSGSSHSMSSYGSHKAIATGDTVGFLLDLTPSSTGTLTVYHNGALVGVPFRDLKGKGKIFPVVSLGRLNRNIYSFDFKVKCPY